jgi:hypothetical protein
MNDHPFAVGTLVGAIRRSEVAFAIVKYEKGVYARFMPAYQVTPLLYPESTRYWHPSYVRRAVVTFGGPCIL